MRQYKTDDILGSSPGCPQLCPQSTNWSSVLFSGWSGTRPCRCSSAHATLNCGAGLDLTSVQSVDLTSVKSGRVLVQGFVAAGKPATRHSASVETGATWSRVATDQPTSVNQPHQVAHFPLFEDAAALRRDPEWLAYLEVVYGDPTAYSGYASLSVSASLSTSLSNSLSYPLDTGHFAFFYYNFLPPRLREALARRPLLGSDLLTPSVRCACSMPCELS